jgi:hypothetical protein
MKLLVAVCVALVASQTYALTVEERHVRLTCMNNVDMAHSSGPDMSKWKYTRGYEICSRLSPAIEETERAEEQAADREIREEDQRNLKAAARQLGIEP